MSPVWVTKQQSAPNIDPGTYALELTNIRQIEVDDFDNPGLRTERIELTFTIRDHPRFGGQSFTEICSPRLGQRSKLGQVMTALNGGVALPDGDHDLEAAIGRRMRAALRKKESGYAQIIAETAVPLEPADLHDA